MRPTDGSSRTERSKVTKPEQFATDSLGIYLRRPGRTDGWNKGEWFGPYSSRREALMDHGLDASREPARTPATISDVALHIFGI